MFSQTRITGLLFMTLTGFLAQANAPIIAHLEWGKIVVKDSDGKEKTYKDCVLSPQGSAVWNWKNTGTEHNPGIQIADLSEFIDNVDFVVLSAGMQNVLQVQRETLDFITSKRKTYYYEQTQKAVERYNLLVSEGKKVGALIHSTC